MAIRSLMVFLIESIQAVDFLYFYQARTQSFSSKYFNPAHLSKSSLANLSELQQLMLQSTAPLDLQKWSRKFQNDRATFCTSFQKAGFNAFELNIFNLVFYLTFDQMLAILYVIRDPWSSGLVASQQPRWQVVSFLITGVSLLKKQATIRQIPRIMEDPDNIGNNIFLIFNFKIYFIPYPTYTFHHRPPSLPQISLVSYPVLSPSQYPAIRLAFILNQQEETYLTYCQTHKQQNSKKGHIIILITGYFSNMELEKSPYETECSEPLIEGQFLMNNLQTRLVVYPDSIYFQNEKLSCTYAINFDFSFDIYKQGNGWLLFLLCPETFRFYSKSHLDEWEQLLFQLIKRRRFHDFYKGLRKLGRGNFASVYLTERVKDKQTFAVKAFQKQATFKPSNGKQGLQNEIKILKRLKHPNIAYLEGVYETDNSIYMVMEFIDGKNLGELLDQQKILPALIRKKIMKGVLLGLAEMESKNIAHRDIKPENIMVTAEGQPKIVDFGLATYTQASKYIYVRCGTPGFVAPEIITIRDNDYVKMSSISDVFSAGAIFYQMIFGRPLFEGQTNSQVLEKNRRCLVSLPTSSDLASFQELVLLRRMLDIFPETRITASQALRSTFFNEHRRPLQEICLGQQKNLSTKHPAPTRPRKVKRLQNCEN